MELEGLGTITMRKVDQLKSCLNSALDRKYCVDRWISDDSLVTLLEKTMRSTS